MIRMWPPGFRYSPARYGAFAPGKNVLDLGCGPGFLLKEAATISPFPSSPHFGLDESASMVLHAMRHLQPPNPVNAASASAAAGPRVRHVGICDASKVHAALRQQSSGSDACYQFDLIVCWPSAGLGCDCSVSTSACSIGRLVRIERTSSNSCERLLLESSYGHDRIG